MSGSRAMETAVLGENINYGLETSQSKLHEVTFNTWTGEVKIKQVTRQKQNKNQNSRATNPTCIPQPSKDGSTSV